MKATLFCLARTTLGHPGPSRAGCRILPLRTPRVLLATYRDSEVYKVVASYGFQTTIEFSEKETVETISIGDSIAWQVVPAGHRVFLKPQEPNAVTNMTVITSLRPYYFELGAKKNRDPAAVTFLLRFTYADSSPSVLGLGLRASHRPRLPRNRPTTTSTTR